ncbi:MAG TPA: FMN-binding negative transcriptional regulator, partial [Planctomycetota bacterium]|nr:FMN-binding negative transcriptional regulator [Planctomycetota bacterium]
AALRAFVHRHSFAQFCTCDSHGHLLATHLPVRLHPDEGPHGVFYGHVARANPQWQDIAHEALLVFTGPHAYISPTWYQTPNTVPTWNYVAVHVTGRIETFDDHPALMTLLNELVDVYEKKQPAPWKIAMDPKVLTGFLNAIIGFKLTVTKWEGKAKLNQNHPVERRQRVIAALQAIPDPDGQAIAALMQATLPPAAAKAP